jgi:hypothetical protein
MKWNLMERKKTHVGTAVREAALEGAHDNILVLLLYYAGSGREDSEGGLALTGIVGLAGLEQGTEQLRPCHACSC